MILPATLFDPPLEDSGRTLCEPARRLVGLAVALGAEDTGPLTVGEQALIAESLDATPTERRLALREIEDGGDPLGERFCDIYRPEERRQRGATYTPRPIIDAMLGWAAVEVRDPARVVDPGAGSGRFVAAAAARYPAASLVAVEADPLAALLTRANLAARGMARRSTVHVEDYRRQQLPVVSGQTLYIGNPPYVRHHEIEADWKRWLTREAKARKLGVSQLAGLHAHFYLATLLKAAPGDFGTFVTASEWLDVNYGKLIRDLFVGPLGGKALILIEPTARPFPDAATTAVVSQFEVGSRPRSIQLGRIDDVPAAAGKRPGRPVRRERFEAERRWSHLTRRPRKEPGEFVELGELCRVHRGAVTGANKFWIEGDHCAGLPDEVFYPTVTRGRELFAAGKRLHDPTLLRRVVDLPPSLDEFDAAERRSIDRFLKQAKQLGIHEGYIAASRRAWWSVGLRDPAPILATYMARRPPVFVRNGAAARHINIAHGVYPRDPMGAAVLDLLASYLTERTCVRDGRTYAGGLTKFEPREMERLLVPPPAAFAEEGATAA